MGINFEESKLKTINYIVPKKVECLNGHSTNNNLSLKLFNLFVHLPKIIKFCLVRFIVIQLVQLVSTIILPKNTIFNTYLMA